ncbi:hypothetical protein Adt_37834 [Abeliophyllum distichum]|uniref:Protein TIC 214 n=1 Tax=Abeliophyllum distichum TaxID=126358 RepID=A0ABD1Q0I1_9LAMI
MEERVESEEERDVEIETASEMKGTKQEQERSAEEDSSPSFFSEEKEDPNKIDETEEIRVNGKEKTQDEFHFRFTETGSKKSPVLEDSYLMNINEKLNATILEQLGAGPSFRTITDMKIMVKIGFNCQLPLSEIGLTSDSKGTGVTSLFHFHSRVLMCFHAL